MSTIPIEEIGSKQRLAPPARGLGRVAVIMFALVTLVTRLFRRRGKATPAQSFGGMTCDEFAQFSSENPPPQKWYDEDVRGLRGVPR